MTGRGARPTTGVSSERSQSNVIAVVLLIGLVFAGATVVVMAGSGALERERGEASFSAAKDSMQSLDAEIEQVGSDDGAADVDLAGFDGGHAFVDESAGSVNVTIEDISSGETDSTTRTLGAVRYEQDRRTLVYQGGGVFRGTENGSVAVSPPPISYRTVEGAPTLHVPVVAVEGTGVDDSVTVNRTRVTDLVEELDGRPESPATNDPANPVPRGTALNITVSSEHYEAWGSVVEDHAGVEVRYDHDSRNASFRLSGREVRSSGVVDRAALSSRHLNTELANSPAVSCYDPDSGDDCSTADVYLQSATGGLSNCFTIEGEFVVEEYPKNTRMWGDSDCGGISIENRTLLGKKTTSNSAIEIGGDVTFEEYTNIVNDVEFSQSNVHFEDSVRVDGKVKKMRRVTVDENLYVEPHPSSNELKMGDGNVIEGDLVVHGRLKVGGTIEVHGEIHTTDGYTTTGNAEILDEDGDPKPESEIHDSDGVQQVRDMMEPELTSEMSLDSSEKPDPVEFSQHVPSETDNDDVSDISDGTLDCDPDGTAETCEIPSGTYHLDNFELGQGDTVRLDPRGGGMKLYVDSAVEIPKNAEVVVEGDVDARVDVFVDGQSGSPTFRMGGTSWSGNDPGKVVTPDTSEPRPSKFWVKMRPGHTVDLDQEAVFTGIIWGPGSGSDDGVDVEIDRDVEVYGGIVGSLDKMVNSAEIHYPSTLESAPLASDQTAEEQPRVVYLLTEARSVRIE